MGHHVFFLGSVLLASLLPLSSRADELPGPDEASWPHLRENVRSVLEVLDRLNAPLSEKSAQVLKNLVSNNKVAGKTAVFTAQRALDAHCLAAVSINPQSRVKAARGPAAATLVQDRAGVVLIKVLNEAGVNSPLASSSPQAQGATATRDQWLEIEVITSPPMSKNLTGQRLEYVVVRLTGRQAGKREATLKFDVGQGTQDLGFRAEVPILFTIDSAKKTKRPVRKTMEVHCPAHGAIATVCYFFSFSPSSPSFFLGGSFFSSNSRTAGRRSGS